MRILFQVSVAILATTLNCGQGFAQNEEPAADSDARNSETVEKKLVRVDPCLSGNTKQAKTKECMIVSGRFDANERKGRAERRKAKIAKLRKEMAREARELPK